MFTSNFFKTKAAGIGAAHHHYDPHDYEDPVEVAVMVPEDMTVEMLKQKHWKEFYQYQLSESDIETIVSDDEQFRKLKMALRNLHCQTDGTFHAMSCELLHKRKQELLLKQSQQLQKHCKTAKHKQRHNNRCWGGDHDDIDHHVASSNMWANNRKMPAQPGPILSPAAQMA